MQKSNKITKAKNFMVLKLVIHKKIHKNPQNNV